MGKAYPMGYDDEWIVSHRDSFSGWKELTDAYNNEHHVNYHPKALMAHAKRHLCLKIGSPHNYDDEWIIERWNVVRNWQTLCNDYNREHGTNLPYTTFKSYCNRGLSLNYHYSVEQLEWLRENYPKHGRVKAAKLFNQIFSENKSPQAIKCQCLRMGLKTSDERRKEIAKENTHRCHLIGAIRPMAHGEPYVKTENGWIPVKHTVVGKQKGKIIVFLDGNCANVDKVNLMFTTRSVSARMTKNRFWSEHPEITKAGIICCELEGLLKERTDEQKHNADRQELLPVW